MTRADRRLVAGILALALLSFLGSQVYAVRQKAKVQEARAVIKAEGRIVQAVDLAEDTTASFPVAGENGPVLVEVEGNRIRIADSPCPDRICVQQGWIDSPGQSVICVPGRVIIYIEGESQVDAIIR